MIGADPSRSRHNLLDLLRNPPALDFSNLPPHKLECAEPKLDRFVSEGDEQTAQRRPKSARVLKDIRDILRKATHKLEYGRLTPEEWKRYFRFAGDRIEKGGEAGRGGKLVAAADDDEDPRWINWSQASAQNWFENDLIPLLDGRQNISAFVLGEPGAGKSTLLKYLLNSNAAWLAQNNIVFSRFEFFKYYKSWHRKTKDFDLSLQRYIAYIFLRDLVRTYQYAHHPDGTMRRVEIGLFAKAQIRNTIREAAAAMAISGEVNDQLVDHIAEVIDKASGDTELDAPLLGLIGHEHAVMLVNYFARTQRAELVLVLDGLDCVSIEDEQLGLERAEVMRGIIARSKQLTDFALWNGGLQNLPIPSTKLFVMRKSTFFFYSDFKDTERSEASTFYVKEIDAEVAMYNAITRSTDAWAARQPAGVELTPEHYEKLRTDLWRATSFMMRSVARPLQIQNAQHRIFDIFGGNLRTVFAFMERLLDWFLDEAISAGIFAVTPRTTVDSAFDLLASAVARRFVKRRNYRIMEVLLYGRMPWFENALTLDASAHSLFQIPGSDEKLRDNPLYLGFAENVFNYHVTRHLPYGDHHALLEKIRVIQLLAERGRGMRIEDIEAALRSRIGYESPDIERTMIVLARSELIHVEFGESRSLLFTASRKGIIMISHLARSLSYLEHVFHRTMFPKQLVRHIKDKIRLSGTEAWAANSIRNLFVLLAYLRYVEENPAAGKKVPYALRFYQPTSDRAISAVRRILWPRHSDDNDDPRWEEIAVRAERLIDNVMNDWERQNLLNAPAPQNM